MAVTRKGSHVHAYLGREVLGGPFIDPGDRCQPLHRFHKRGRQNFQDARANACDQSFQRRQLIEQ